jgi:glycosyltransferase involved in cell wall biosynthesis
MVGYNSKPWIRKSVESALAQNHENFDVIAIDAETNDGTYDILCEYQTAFNFTLIRNSPRKYQSQNIFEGSKLVKNGSIIVTLDFDDWLYDDNVLTVLDKIYNDNVWMTYGGYITNTGRLANIRAYSDDIVRENKFREDDWKATHLRTFRRELILKIKEEDFFDDNGEWFKAAGDLTFMIPMLEMSGERFEWSRQPLYVYNLNNSLSDGHMVPHEQIRISNLLKSRPKYERIDSL